MDPDAALQNIREYVDELRDATNPEDLADAAVNVCEAFDTLDNWLKVGGFLPREWTS